MAGKAASIESIQWLRGFAALAVVAFHAASRFNLGFEIGAAGVDVFFVISGFIMQYTTASDITPATFLHRRAARVIPFYWLVTGGTAAAATIVPAMFPNLKLSLGHLVLSLLFIPHIAPDGSPFPVVAPGWTLNLEIFFYACFAASMLLRRPARIPALAAAFGALVVFRWLFPPTHIVLVELTSPLLLEFIAGVLLGRAWLAGALPRLGTGAALVPVGIAGFTLVASSGLDAFGPRRFLWCGVPAFLVVLGTVTIEARHGLRSLPSLRVLGDASYSLYLLHPNVIGAAMKVTRGVPIAARLAVCIAASVAVALLSAKFVERPLSAAFRRWPPWARRGLAAHKRTSM